MHETNDLEAVRTAVGTEEMPWRKQVLVPIEVYSPTQVALGTLGGPVGLVYFLWSNFVALGNHRAAKKTLLIGSALIVVLIAATPFIPERVPSTTYALVYLIIGRYVAEKHQMTKAAILASENHTFHSNWRVFGFGLVSLIGSLAVLVLPLFLLVAFGVLEP